MTLEFHERGAASELVLIHERFPTAKAAEDHTRGWGSSLDKLPQAL